MSIRFDNKVAVVTGAATGIGAATAHKFVELGAGVALFWPAIGRRLSQARLLLVDGGMLTPAGGMGFLEGGTGTAAQSE